MIAHRGKYVAYYRVSTQAQGKSGLGLAAQKAAVRQRLDGGSWQLVGEYTEIESGKRVRRPQLEAALAACKKHKAKLIVAKLDRLARNTHFLLTLINAGVEPLFADLPEMPGAMGRFMLTSMAAIAELEAGLIAAHQGRARRGKAARREARCHWRAARQAPPRRGRPAPISSRPSFVSCRTADCRCARSPPSCRNARCRRRRAARGTRRPSPASCGGLWRPDRRRDGLTPRHVATMLVTCEMASGRWWLQKS